jgi:hypothetical protein
VQFTNQHTTALLDNYNSSVVATARFPGLFLFSLLLFFFVVVVVVSLYHIFPSFSFLLLLPFHLFFFSFFFILLPCHSTTEPFFDKILYSRIDRNAARVVGLVMARRLKAQGIERVYWDMDGKKYHGRVRGREGRKMEKLACVFSPTTQAFSSSNEYDGCLAGLLFFNYLSFFSFFFLPHRSKSLLTLCAKVESN